jgi:hypothetical protein
MNITIWATNTLIVERYSDFEILEAELTCCPMARAAAMVPTIDSV